MWTKNISICILLISVNFKVLQCLRIRSIDVPKYAKVGDNLLLSCNFLLGGDQLYSVKWYKDNMEFYRYVPKDYPHAQEFGVSGVRVALDKSDDKTVEIISIALDTAGTYMCEVSSEAPRFKTVEASTDLTVIHPPPSPPHLTKPVPGGRYRVGDMFELNCSSPASSPPAKLRYFINNQMDDGSHTVMHRSVGPGGLISPTLTLSTRLTRSHFQGGIVRVRCEAIIYTLWGESTEEIYPGVELGEKALERILAGNNGVIRDISILQIFLVITLAMFW